MSGRTSPDYTKLVYYNLKIPEKQYETFKRLASILGISTSTYIRILIFHENLTQTFGIGLTKLKKKSHTDWLILLQQCDMKIKKKKIKNPKKKRGRYKKNEKKQTKI